MTNEDPEFTTAPAPDHQPADELTVQLVEALSEDLETWVADRPAVGLQAWLAPRLDARRAGIVAEYGERGAAAFNAAMLAAHWLTSRYT